MIRPFRRMHELGLLGMNQRNADFIMKYNPRKFYPLVDDKRQTKKRALELGIAVPELYGVVEIQQQAKRLGRMLEGRNSFVIKPAQGSGGDGIMVISDRLNEQLFLKASGDVIDLASISHHITNILTGMYSLGGVPDVAMIEYRVEFDPVFDNISYKGVPDIRTIVFKGVPVLAMIRLPTRRSDGKANLHQGAVGVGIDLASGQTTQGVYQNQIVSNHPDTTHPVAGVTIPYWQEILSLASQCQQMVGLDYLGVDIVIDREYGPMMLELNARPGLSIQICNQSGLLHRLRRIERTSPLPEATEQLIALGQHL